MLGQVEFVGRVAVDFVGAQVDKRAFRAGAACGFEQVERADGVGVEVGERDRGGAVVRRLGGGVDDGVGLQIGEQREDAVAVAHIDLVVRERLVRVLEALLVPARVAFGTEEDGALVVVDAADEPALS